MNMIEEVARALDPEIWRIDGPIPTRADVIEFHERRAKSISQARLAIEAMIIPTKGMLGEAAKAMSPGKRPTPEFVSVNQKHKIRYQAMIRKALEE